MDNDCRNCGAPNGYPYCNDGCRHAAQCTGDDTCPDCPRKEPAMDQHTSETRFAICSQLWDAARNFRRFPTYEQDQTSRRNQYRARIKYELLDHAHWAAVGLTLIGTFISLDNLLHHNRQLIPVLTTTIVAIGAASLLNALLNLTLTDIRARLYTAASTTTEGTDPR